MIMISTQAHPLLVVPFNAAMDFTVLAQRRKADCRSAVYRTRANLAFGLSLIYPRRRPDPETASHFVYLIRNNPLNRKNSFL